MKETGRSRRGGNRWHFYFNIEEKTEFLDPFTNFKSFSVFLSPIRSKTLQMVSKRLKTNQKTETQFFTDSPEDRHVVVIYKTGFRTSV